MSNELTLGWDKRYATFFDKMKIVLSEGSDNLYNKIKEFNKWDSIFPQDVQLNKAK